jgi:hypothetical protein
MPSASKLKYFPTYGPGIRIHSASDRDLHEQQGNPIGNSLILRFESS